MEGDTTSNVSSMADVPPYLKQQYTPLTEVFQAHTATLPSKQAPESNSDAVIRSLKALQEKIRSLEMERVATADRFKVLSKETNTTPLPISTAATSTVAMGTDDNPPDLGTSSPVREPAVHDGLKSRLDLLDERLAQQAHELDVMQQKLKMTDTPPKQQLHITHTPHPTHTHHPLPKHKEECKCSVAEEKLRTLEQGVHKLKAAQNKTKERVQQLETCVRSNPRAGAKLKTKARDERHTPQERRKPRPKAKKTKSVSSKQGKGQSLLEYNTDGLALKCLPRPVPGVHYRLDMRHLPFILGSSTSPSHSVCANYQQVVSLMKTHNHILCGAAALKANGHCRNNRGHGQIECRQVARGKVSEKELEALLTGLEEEYGTITFEHQALSQHLKDHSLTHKPRVKASLELQLKQLEDQLDSKSEQIQIVTKQLHGYKLTSTAVSTLEEEPIAMETPTKLCFLKKMKALQSTLQGDDLNWK